MTPREDYVAFRVIGEEACYIDESCSSSAMSTSAVSSLSIPPPDATSTSNYSSSNSSSDSSHDECSAASGNISHVLNYRPLALILDLDGTLIVELDEECHDETERLVEGFDDSKSQQQQQQSSSRDHFIRPGAIDFLQWCLDRGYALAVWTAAHSSWANYVCYKLCTQIHGDHNCCGSNCTRTFDFCWSRQHLQCRKRIPVITHGEGIDKCRWCDQYRHTCTRCECYQNTIFQCPCRLTKNLRKVWTNQSTALARFHDKNRVLIVENTPQVCIHNYGNAIYVPTYTTRINRTKSALDGEHEQYEIFSRLKVFLVNQLEPAYNVRTVSKCGHGNFPHACYEQNWWDSDCSHNKNNSIIN